MANKRINELALRTPQTTDLMLIGDPTTGYSYKNTLGAITANLVPYSGATSNVNLGEFGLSTGYVSFDLTPTSTPTSQGTMYWDDASKTVALIMNGTTQKIGLDQFYMVKNSTGATIAKGTAVGFAGTDGNSGHLLIKKFQANGVEPSQYYMGITSEDIVSGGFGKVMRFGRLDGVNTSAFADGNILYVSTSVAGGFQTSVPVAPNNIIVAAAVVSAGNNGKLIVRETLGSNINNDEGVRITNPTTNQLLSYNGSLWVNTSSITLTSLILSGFGTGILKVNSGSVGVTTGSNNYVPKWSANDLVQSQIFDNGSFVGINTTTDNLSGAKLQVSGNAYVNGFITVPSNASTGALSGFVTTYSGNAASRSWKIINDLVEYGDWAIQQSTTQTGSTYASKLYFNASGAATFSSSVTAGAIISTGVSTFSRGTLTFQINPSYAGGNVYSQLQSTGALALATNGDNNRLYIDTNGNIGIGVTPSAANLPTLEMQYGLFNGTSEVNISQNVVYNSGFKYGANGFATRYYQGNGNHQWFNASSGTAGSAITFTQAMTLDASGRLGIGTSSPSDLLHINGSNQYLRLSSTGTVTGIKHITTQGSFFAGMGYATGANDYEIFDLSASATRLLITSSGRILMGTTTDNLTDLLQVAGSAYVVGELRVKSAAYLNSYNTSLRSDGSANGILQLGNNGTNYILAGNTAAGGHLIFKTNVSSESIASGTEALRLTSSGAAEISSTIKTAAPSGGTAQPWKLGNAGVSIGGSDGSAVAVEINGTVYYLMTAYLP